VALEDLRTGQHVVCFDATPYLTQPTQQQYCEVGMLGV
jgi:hypothetical protein